MTKPKKPSDTTPRLDLSISGLYLVSRFIWLLISHSILNKKWRRPNQKTKTTYQPTPTWCFVTAQPIPTRYFVTAQPTPIWCFVTAQLTPTQYFVTYKPNSTWYFVTAQQTSTQYFVTARDKDFTILRQGFWPRNLSLLCGIFC